MEHVTGFVNLYTGYAKYKWKNLRIVACGAYGNLHQTHQLYHLTGQLEDANQLLGKNTFGYYLETGFDLLPYFRNNVADKGNWLYNKSEMKLPVFVRYERLDTHSDINAQLRNLGTVFPRSNFDIVTFGVNFKPKENIVLKANYQLRHGRLANQSEPDQIELGIGFIF